MSILKVARIGHPAVRAAAAPVPEDQIRSADIQRLIDDMVETMHEYDGVGLAAPQIHVGLRIAVIEVPGVERPQAAPPHRPSGIHSREGGPSMKGAAEDADLRPVAQDGTAGRQAAFELDDERSEGGVPLTVLVNPAITPMGSEGVLGWEGCLSVPDLRGQVPRLARLRLEAWDREGQHYAVEASGFFARVIQHECDHLDGRVYLDRMKDMRSLSFLPEFERHVHQHEDE